MKVKMFAILFCSICFLALCIPCAYAAGIQITVDGKAVAFAGNTPYVDSHGRTLVPLRSVADALGAKTEWDNNRKSATVEKTISIDSKTVKLSMTFYPNDVDFGSQFVANTEIGSNTLDFGLSDMDTNAILKNGSTYLPIRYIAEYFGYTVHWDAPSQTVQMKSTGTPGSGVSNFSLSKVPTGDITVQDICKSVWVSHGNRLIDTWIHTMKADGTWERKAATGGSMGNGIYTLQGNTLILRTEDGKSCLTLDYDVEKNIFVSRNGKRYVWPSGHEDPRSDKEAPVNLQPYSENPYTSKRDFDSLRQSILPEEFSASKLKETMAPYLDALQSIDYPPHRCDLDYDDEITLGSYWFHSTNFSSVDQVAEGIRPYFTDEYFQENFQFDHFKIYNNKLYVSDLPVGVGWLGVDNDSPVDLLGKNEIGVTVKEYSSGDTLCGVCLICFREVDGRYVISGVHY